MVCSGVGLTDRTDGEPGMGRHQMGASSSARARVALGALPLVATVGAIGIGSVVMSPVSSEAPLEPPVGAGGLAPAPSVPIGPGVAPAPVQVLDLAATDGSVSSLPVTPGSTIGSVRPAAGGGDATPARRGDTRVVAADDAPARGTAASAASTPARGGGGGGGGNADTGGGGGGTGGGGGSTGSGNAGDAGGSGGSGGAESSGGSGGSGGGSNGGLLGGVGGAVGGVVGGLKTTVSGTTSLLSFGEPSESVLSFD
ncbi:hypothetical protein GCM10023204_48640 [Actinomycetospora succinea]